MFDLQSIATCVEYSNIVFNDALTQKKKKVKQYVVHHIANIPCEKSALGCITVVIGIQMNLCNNLIRLNCHSPHDNEQAVRSKGSILDLNHRLKLQ